jgi:glutamine synthetase
MLSVDELRTEIGAGTIDTVVTAFTDMQGRLVGKRIEVGYFLDEVADHGVEGCNYLLALDMEMDPVPGYDMANWETGYGDFGIVPDLTTLRRVPWLDRTAMVLCDVTNHGGPPVAASPRQVLIAQYDRAQQLGYTPLFASELEFYLYKQSYAEAHERDYRELTPTIPYILDYHILATTMDEQYLGPIRRGMQGAGIPIEFSKGEAWYGQHEVNTRYADAVTSADRHAIYKNGVKEIAFLNGVSATFMAKP